MGDVIQLDTETDDPQPPENHNEDGQSHCEPEDTTMSTSPPEHSFPGVDQCFKSINQSRILQQNHKARQEPEFNHGLKAFDYIEARKNIIFGEPKAEKIKDDAVARAINKDSGDKRRTLNQPGARENEGNGQNPRRRQAFPTSSNRNATYH
ncbi:hypothetical protein ABZP36_030292 [Zizania latifolia]